MGEMTVTTTQTQMLQASATDVAADGAATVNVKFESIRMDMASAMGSFSYDSAAPPAQAADPVTSTLAAVMGAMVGESISVVLSPTGAIRSLDGGTRLMEKIRKASPDVSAGMNMLGGFDAMMSDDAWRGTFGQSFASLPDKPVKPGDSWQSTVKVPSPMGEMIVDTTYALKGVERLDGRDVARIAFTQRTKSSGTGAMGPMTAQLGDGTGEGEVAFDPKQGRVVRTVVRSTMPMSLSMTAPDGSSISMQAQTKNTLTMDLVER
jgi:surface antigen